MARAELRPDLQGDQGLVAAGDLRYCWLGGPSECISWSQVEVLGEVLGSPGHQGADSFRAGGVVVLPFISNWARPD